MPKKEKPFKFSHPQFWTGVISIVIACFALAWAILTYVIPPPSSSKKEEGIKVYWETNDEIRDFYYSLEKEWRRYFDNKLSSINEINIFSEHGNDDKKAEIILKKLKDCNVGDIYGVHSPESGAEIPMEVEIRYSDHKDEIIAKAIALFIQFTTSIEIRSKHITTADYASKNFEIWMNTQKDNEVKPKENFRKIYQQALDCYGEGKFDDAIKYFNIAKTLSLKNEYVFFNCALAYHNRDKPGDLTYAIDDYSFAIEFARKKESTKINFASVHFNRGNAYFNREDSGDKLRAIRDYTDAIRIVETKKLTKPKIAAIYLNRGHVYVAIEEIENALKDYKKVIEISPDSYESRDAKKQLSWLEKK